jgi:L-malate glycosyltransferase
MPAIGRVAVCSVGELYGGVERHILGLLQGLRARGVSTRLIVFHDGELAAQARRQGDHPFVLPGSNIAFLSACRRLAAALAESAITVVHAHGYKATVACAMARRWHACALVKTEHGLPEPMAGRPVAQLRDRIYHVLDAAATRRSVAAVCCVTEQLRARARNRYPGSRIAWVPNGIADLDSAAFARPPEYRSDRFNVAVVGRIDTVKGHHVALNALATAAAPVDAHLQIIGTGPAESDLRALARELGVSERVHFLGFRRNVFDYVAHCDALLMPSLHEGLPFVLLEAMGLGVAIVASRVGGLAEVMRDGECGVLVPPGDAPAIARALAALRGDSSLRRRLGLEARARQRAQYSVRQMTERYLEVYESVGPAWPRVHSTSP